MQVAPRLRGALRPGDEIGRFGGDEFVVIVRGTADERGAAAIAARIVAAFESPFKLSAREHFAKVSVGVALVDPARSTPVSLLRDADAALYEAKNRGRARFEIFDSVMRTRTVERLAIEDDLRKGLFTIPYGAGFLRGFVSRDPTVGVIPPPSAPFAPFPDLGLERSEVREVVATA